MITTTRAAIARWIEQHLVAVDPSPEYSALDARDGRG